MMQQHWDRASIQAALLDNYILTHDEPVSGHLAQPGQNATYVLVSIHKTDDDRQLASSFNQVSGMDSASSKKTGNGMERHGAGHTLVAQVFEQLQVQRTMMP